MDLPLTHTDSRKKMPTSAVTEESVRRMRVRDNTRIPYPGNLPKATQSDRNSFHPPSIHGKKDPAIPADTRTRKE